MNELKVQPNNIELEQGLLGCIIMDPNQFWKVEPYVTTTDIFYNSNNRYLWMILCTYRSKTK